MTMENLSNSNLARLGCASMLSNQEKNLIDQNLSAKKKATNLPYGRKTKINVSTLRTKITIVLWESVSS